MNVWQPEPPPYRVPVEPWLDDLLSQYEMAKARAEEAAEYAKSLDAKIKAALTASMPQGTSTIEVAGSAHRKPRTLKWTTPRKFDSKRFARENPETYEAYKTWAKPYWSW